MIIHAYETRVPFTIGVGQKSRGISTVGAWAAIGGRLAKSASAVFSRLVRAAAFSLPHLEQVSRMGTG